MIDMSWSAHDRQVNGGRRVRYLFMFTFSLINGTFLHSPAPASWTHPLAPGSDHTFVSSRKTSVGEEDEETGSMAREVGQVREGCIGKRKKLHSKLEEL